MMGHDLHGVCAGGMEIWYKLPGPLALSADRTVQTWTMCPACVRGEVQLEWTVKEEIA